MINFPYFKYTVKSNFKFLVAFTAILCIFITVMTNVFTPTVTTNAEVVLGGTILENILTGDGTLVGFMSNSFYALMAVVFPMVYSIIVGNRMVAEKIDRGYMAGFMATPVTRLQIILSSALYFILSLIVMWGVVSIVGIAVSNVFQPDELDIDTFLLLNIGICLYHLVISGICFCSSCIFNTSKGSLILGAGVPLYFFVMSLIIKLSENLDFLKYFTLNTLFDTQKILEGSGYTENFIIMLAIAIILYIIGITYFCKKDLPL